MYVPKIHTNYIYYSKQLWKLRKSFYCYFLIMDGINRLNEDPRFYLISWTARKSDEYHEVSRRVYTRVMTWWVVYDNCRNWENSQRLAKYPNAFSRLCSALYAIYMRKIRSQALTCFMVVEKEGEQKFTARCLQSVAVTPRRSPPFIRHPPSALRIRVGCIFPPTGYSRRAVRFRCMRH